MRQSLAIALLALLAAPALADAPAGPPQPLGPQAEPPPAPQAPAPVAAPAPTLPSATTAAPAQQATPAQPAAPAAEGTSRATLVPSCLPEIAKAEKRYRIPDGLLVAIALVESGRRDPATGVLAPWPWTIDSHGRGEYFDTVDDAAIAAGKLLAANDALVDVGCMQVDLFHHPHAFRTLLAAFDPETNVDYAANFLVDLREKTGSWTAAAAAYHTGDPATGGEYVARVLYYWKELGTTAATAQAAATPERRGFVIDTRPAPLEIAADFYGKKDYGAAKEIYRAVLVAEPDDQTALLGLAQTLRAEGRNEDARAQLERLLTGNPGNRAALVTLLAIVDELPPAQRLTALLSARQIAPASAQVPARLATLEADRGNLSDAIAQMGAAVRLAPEDATLRLDYALLLDRGGYAAAAVAAYREFLRLYRPGSIALTVPIDQVRQRLSFLMSHNP